jgi:hypothetical protein
VKDEETTVIAPKTIAPERCTISSVIKKETKNATPKTKDNQATITGGKDFFCNVGNMFFSSQKSNSTTAPQKKQAIAHAAGEVKDETASP